MSENLTAMRYGFEGGNSFINQNQQNHLTTELKNIIVLYRLKDNRKIDYAFSIIDNSGNYDESQGKTFRVVSESDDEITIGFLEKSAGYTAEHNITANKKIVKVQKLQNIPILFYDGKPVVIQNSFTFGFLKSANLQTVLPFVQFPKECEYRTVENIEIPKNDNIDSEKQEGFETNTNNSYIEKDDGFERPDEDTEDSTSTSVETISFPVPDYDRINEKIKNIKIDTSSFDRLQGANKCNFTSLAMAIQYAGYSSKPASLANYKTRNDSMVEQLLECLARGLNSNITQEEVPNLLQLTNSIGVINIAPHECLENMKAVGNYFIEKHTNGTRNTVEIVNFTQGNFNQTVYDSIHNNKIPVLGVQGYYNNEGNFTTGGHYVCCSGVTIKENSLTHLKIDDPWGVSPTNIRGSLEDGGKLGDDVIWYIEDFKTTMLFSANGSHRSQYLTVRSVNNLLRKDGAKSVNVDTETLATQKNQAEIDSFLSRWMCYSAETPTKKQGFLDINNYYDFYSGMTPIIELKFRNGLKEKNGKYSPTFVGINSIEHPFIKSLTVKDNGVKTITLELFDKDFGSLTEGFVVKEDETSSFTLKSEEKEKKLYSLDSLIKQALATDLIKKEEEEKVGDNPTKLQDKTFTIRTTYGGATIPVEGAMYNENEYEKAKAKDYKSPYNFGNDKITDFQFGVEAGLGAKVHHATGKTPDQKLISEAAQKLIDNYVSVCDSLLNSYVGKHTDMADVKYTEDGKIDTEELLKFTEGEPLTTPTNLKIKFGYCDFNESLSANNNLKSLFPENSKRTNRWWDFTNGEAEEHKVVTDFTIDIKNEKYIEGTGMTLTNDSAVNQSTEKNSQGETTKVNEGGLEDSPFQTRSASRWLDFMITNFQSSLTSNGIVYTITAVETKEAVLMSKRFLQRFTEITAYPEEVLYVLMQCFNENKEGKVLNTPVKLLLMKDDEKAPDGFNNVEEVNSRLVQQYDLKLMREKGFEEILYEDTYNALLNGQSLHPEYLKPITISLGSEQAINNYREIRNTPYLYKSVSALLNEFCAACPPKKLLNNKKKYNSLGEEINVDENNQTARQLKWFSVKNNEDTNSPIYVVLYYRREIKPKKIRIYKWGPALPYKTCVKSISIQNKGEYALMSGVKTFCAESSKVRSRINEKDVEVTTEQASELNKENGFYDLIAQNKTVADAYEIALSNGVYEGTIELLGDPFFLFGTYIQPMTYPIKLEVYVPVSDWEYKNKGRREEINTRRNVREVGNQLMYDYSGYYLIKEINHSITPSGFVTKLDVISYPGIEDNILIDKEKGPDDSKPYPSRQTTTK